MTPKRTPPQLALSLPSPTAAPLRARRSTAPPRAARCSPSMSNIGPLALAMLARPLADPAARRREKASRRSCCTSRSGTSSPSSSRRARRTAASSLTVRWRWRSCAPADERETELSPLAAEDNLNISLKDITVTQRDGRITQLDQVYIRGPVIRFFIVPDMLANAPMCVCCGRGGELYTAESRCSDPFYCSAC